jgi:hypothetical protein
MTLLEQLRATYQALGEQLHQLELAAGTATSLSAISAPHPAPPVTIHSDGSSTEAIVDVAANFLMLRDSAGKALHNYRVPHGAPGGFCAEVGSTAQAYQSYFFQMGDKPELSVVRVDGTKSTIGDTVYPGSTRRSRLHTTRTTTQIRLRARLPMMRLAGRTPISSVASMAI